MSSIDEYLSQQLGITKDQALSSVGIFMSYVVERLECAELIELQAILPNVHELISLAPDLTLVESGFRTSGPLAVQIDDNYWGFLSLQAKSLICIGLHPDSMSDIIVEMVLFVKSKGKDTLAMKLRGVLGH